MKKIIAAFDGLKYSESTASYAIEIAKKYNGKIFGIFLEDFTYHSYSITDLAADDYPEQHAARLNKVDAETRESSVKHFAQQCEEHLHNSALYFTSLVKLLSAVGSFFEESDKLFELVKDQNRDGS